MFSDLAVGETIQVLFPRGGSVGGTVLEIHRERPEKTWILLAQPSGAKTTVYENEVGYIVTE